MHAGNRCWQIMTSRPRWNREPANEVNEEDATQGIPVWLQPITVNLEDLEAHVLAHSSERENSDSEGDASKVETHKRKHRGHAYFRKNQNWSILRADKYGDLKTAEHKSLNEGRDFRNNHRYAAVVQVLNGIRAKPKLHKTRRRITKVPKAVAEAKSFSYVQFIKIWQVLWRITMESSNNNTSSIRDKRNCRTSCTSNKRRDISRIIAISIGW